MKKSLLPLISIFSLSLLSGCGTSTPPPPLAVATQLSVSPSSVSVTAGAAVKITVSALDSSGAVVSTYSGTVHFTSSDPQATLPANSTLSNGAGAFSVTFKTTGNQNIAATDTAKTSITGSSGPINVLSNAPATHFAVTVPTSVTARLPFSLGVTALDAANNPAVSYSGTVHLTSTDGQAHLPADSPLANGWTQLSATLETAGSHTITANDTATTTLTGSSSTINVTAPPALIITSGPPPNGTVGSRYNPHLVRVCVIPIFPDRCAKWVEQVEFFFPLTATGGLRTTGLSWSWAAAPGSALPPGLTLPSGSSAITGTPVVGSAGTYKVIVTVTDSGTPPAQTSVNYSITINNPPPPVINTVPAPPGATLKQPFSFGFTATNGLLPLTWSESGVLPPGLSSFSSDGVLSGTPTAAGPFPITVNVQDADGQNATPENFTIQVFTRGFGLTGNMQAARLLHTATLLSNGKVLVAGGQVDITHLLASAELFNPSNGTFTSTGSMQTSRAQHTATLLCDLTSSSCANNKVLVAGGESVTDGNAVDTAELYVPATGTFTTTGSMSTARYGHTATLLRTGKVLITGGVDSSGKSIASAELFDPATGTFAFTGSMVSGRSSHTATLLADGRVLVAGGFDANSNHLASAELYDPAAGGFAPAGTMTVSRVLHAATLLSSGMVLLTGGGGTSGNPLDSAELFDPSNNSFTATGNLVTARASHTAVLLNDGTVLLAGGEYKGSILRNAELYNPVAGEFTATGGMQTGRFVHTMTVLGSSGAVLVTGGISQAPALDSAELYQ